ncbi:MAG TPA: response regulator [Steroidobacteraceae bacterium]|jgi:HD-like signal output (HDOD) protein|nr:response regulator [Steroidobacteraceae bacterium]
MKRVLFVDDDQNLLGGLRSRLYKRRKEWEMVFAESGMAALEELTANPVDLIVSDIRMPGMDGADLLSTVKKRWPKTIRMVLSGYAEEEKLLQLVSLAHRYLSKPCDMAQVEAMIERCLLLDALLQSPKLQALVGRIGALPALPKTYAALQAALSKENVQATTVAEIITRDPAIAAKVLQVVNSAFFRLPKPATGIKQAVNHLGFTTIRNLVMSAEVFSQWHKIEGVQGLDPEKLQANAQLSAAACMALARGTSMQDDAMLVGLLHDIGYWILLQECPKELTAALMHAQTVGIPTEQAEREVVGASHAEIGAYLLGLWGFPYQIVEAVAFHHVPTRLPHAQFDLLCILDTAHTLVVPDEAHALPLSSEQSPIVDENYFNQSNPPYSWHEAMQRVASVEIAA